MFSLFLVSVCIVAVSCAPQGIATTNNQRIPQPQPAVNAVPSGQQSPRSSQQRNSQGEQQQFQAQNQFQQQQPQQFQPGQGPQPHPGSQFPPQGPPQGQLSGPSSGPQQEGQLPPGQPYPSTPQIYWGRCPQLEPTMEEKVKKASVITKCLEVTPVPQNITQETVEIHREQVAACALQMEGWFNEKGLYKYDKAESEIKAKRLTKEIEERILSYHKQCKEEAEEKFPVSNKNLISQIQLYQACMDYFISDVCGIDVLRR